MQASPTTVNESLTPATPLIDAIRAQQTHQHAARMALLDDPVIQERIALAEDLADALKFAGFATLQQQIFYVNDLEHEIVICLHITIHNNHVIAGTQALMAILAERGGHLSSEKEYSEAGRSINLCIHCDGVFRGWLAEPKTVAA